MYFAKRILILFTIVLTSDFICLGTRAEDASLKTLRQVQVVYRHGDRTPLKSYPNDPYNNESVYWPQGPGQLTDKGKDQQYDLGQFLRQRYDGFIDRQYDMDEIHVLSSDTDRSLMSAEANVAGFYPRTAVLRATRGGSQSRSESSKLDIQLVPIHTVPKHADKMLKMSAPCPRKQDAWIEYLSTSQEYKQVLADSREFLEFLSKNAGMPITSIFSLTAVYDPLFCEQQHGLALPEWANSTVMERIEELRSIAFKMMYAGTTEIRRLKGGPLAKQMIENMEGIKNGGQKSYKFHMYSAHDDTVAAVMSTMDVFDPQIPSYASTFIVELHEDEKDGKPFVKLFYRNRTSDTPYALQVPGCGSPCYLEEMTEALRPAIPDNWEQECYYKFGSNVLSSAAGGGNDPATTNTNYMAIIAGFLGVVALCIIVWLSVLVISSKWERRSLFVEKEPILKESYTQMA